MASMPKWMRRHEVTVEAYLGQSAYGPRYGAPGAVPCFLDAQTQMVRAADGTQVTSTSIVRAPLDTVAPAQSRVTLPDGRITSVIAALRRDGGGLPTPDHLELQLV